MALETDKHTHEIDSGHGPVVVAEAGLGGGIQSLGGMRLLAECSDLCGDFCADLCGDTPWSYT